MIPAQAIIRIGQSFETGEEHFDVFMREEAAAAAKPPRDAADVQRAQEDVGLAVGSHHDRDIARPPPV